MSDPSRLLPPQPVLTVLACVVTSLVLAGCRHPASSPQGAAPVDAVASDHAPPPTGPRDVPGELPQLPEDGLPRSLDIGDGEVPDGVTVFDDQYPAVAQLNRELLDALRGAAMAAARDGVRFYVVSGWRSRRYQEQLFREAVATYGSTQRAARWVAPPGTSPHESGQAVDLGPTSATAWLAAHGASYGLCQIYANEDWHYELRPLAVTYGCTAMYADPTHDPRMQR